MKILEEENLGIPAWISFNSKDGQTVVRGDSFEECVKVAHACKHVVAVGVNCTPPRFVKDLILIAKKVCAGCQIKESSEYSPACVISCNALTWLGDTEPLLCRL